MLGDITAGSAYKFAQWLELVRKRSGQYPYSGFPRRPLGLDHMLTRFFFFFFFSFLSTCELNVLNKKVILDS